MGYLKISSIEAKRLLEQLAQGDLLSAARTAVQEFWGPHASEVVLLVITTDSEYDDERYDYTTIIRATDASGRFVRPHRGINTDQLLRRLGLPVSPERSDDHIDESLLPNRIIDLREKAQELPELFRYVPEKQDS